MLKKVFLFILISLFISSITSQDNKEKLETLYRAIAKISNDDEAFKYSSTIEIKDSDGKNIQEIKFDPTKVPQFVLIGINGEKPSEKDIKRFKKEMESERKSSTSFNDILGETYTLESRENGIACYSYISSGNMIPGKKSKLNGKIWVNEVKEEVLKIELKNSHKIKLAVGVSMNTFFLEFNFIQFNKDISVVDVMTTEVEGKAFMVKFELTTKNRMFDYELADKL